MSQGGEGSATQTQNTSEPCHVRRPSDSRRNQPQKRPGGDERQQRCAAPEPNHLQPGAERGARARFASTRRTSTGREPSPV